MSLLGLAFDCLFLLLLVGLVVVCLFDIVILVGLLI